MTTLIRNTLLIAAALFTSASALAAADLSEGEVRKVDRDNGKLTIKHGPLKNLDMPGMTMVFIVQEPAVLDTVKPGERIRFQAERIDGAFIATQIEAVR